MSLGVLDGVVGVNSFGVEERFFGVVGRSTFLWDVGGFGLAAIVLRCPTPSDLLSCFET